MKERKKRIEKLQKIHDGSFQFTLALCIIFELGVHKAKELTVEEIRKNFSSEGSILTDEFIDSLAKLIKDILDVTTDVMELLYFIKARADINISGLEYPAVAVIVEDGIATMFGNFQGFDARIIDVDTQDPELKEELLAEKKEIEENFKIL